MLVDIIFIVLILFGCIKGLRRGFIIALFSIIAFIAGIAAALKLSAYVATRLSENINIPSRWLPVLSFILIFLLVAFLVNLGGRLIQKSFQAVMLGWLDKLAGAVLFIFLYGIIYSVFLFYAVQLHILKPDAVGASRFYAYIQPLAPSVMKLIGHIIPFFKDVFAQLAHFFEDVCNKVKR